jgi:hypothetical protein
LRNGTTRCAVASRATEAPRYRSARGASHRRRELLGCPYRYRRAGWGHHDRRPRGGGNVQSGSVAGRAARAVAYHYCEQRAIVGRRRRWSRIRRRSRAADRSSVFPPLVAERGRARYGYREIRRLPYRNICTDRLRTDRRRPGRAIACGIARRFIGACQTCAPSKVEGSCEDKQEKR